MFEGLDQTLTSPSAFLFSYSRRLLIDFPKHIIFSNFSGIYFAYQIQQPIPKLRIRIFNFSINKNSFIILACLFVYVSTLFIISNRENLRFVKVRIF